MYKLSLKFSVIGLLAPLILAGAAVVLPQQPSLNLVCSLHVSIIFAIMLGACLICSVVLYDRGSLVQKYQAMMSMFAFTTLYGTLGNFLFNYWKWQGQQLEFNATQLGCMIAGGILTTFALYKLEPFDSFGSGGLERLHKGKSQEGPAVVTPDQLAEESAEDFMKKGQASKLRGITSKTDAPQVQPAPEVAKKNAPSSVESAQALMTPPVEIDLDASDEMLSGPLNPSPTPSQAPAAKAAPLEDKKSAATNNRLQAQKRRNTSTFTKLQALSASGTGSLKPTPISESSTGGGDLRSLLDRLDAEPSSEEYEIVQAPEEIRAEILFSEYESKPKAEPTKPAQPLRPQPSAQSAPSKPFQPSTPTSAPGRDAPKPTPLQRPAVAASSTASGGGPSPVAGPLARAQQNKQPSQTPPGANTPRLASLLDRAESMSDDAEPAEKASEKAGASKVEPPKVEAFDATPKDEVSHKEEPESGGLLAKRFMELSEDDEKELEAGSLAHAKADPSDKLFNENVDEEIDDIFSSMAPAEAQKEVEHKEEPEPAAEDEPASPTAEAEPEAQETLFGESVDGDVDDLFSGLAPAEAQRTVEEVRKEKEEQEAQEEEPAADAQTEDEPESKLFGGAVDGDVDDLFSGLASAEAQRTVEEVRKEKEEAEQAEEEVTEEEEKPQDNLFGESVDGDVDDLFSGLAPAEAQRTVEEVRKEKEEAESSEEQATAEAEEPAAQDNLFGESVDGDVDDLFSGLAPAEAQRTVEEVRKERSVQSDQEVTGDFTPPKEEEGEEEKPKQDDGLFQLGDSDVDDIFAGLTTGDQLDVNAQTLAKVRGEEEEEQEVPIPASLVETGDRIPVINPDSMPKSAKQTGDMPAMSQEQAAKLRDQVAKGDEESDEEDESIEVEAAPESPEAAKLKKELKEFGKLSVKSASAPKAQGESVGTMKTIGKLLIDNQAIENIIKAGETRKIGSGLATARIISSARGQGIMELLHKIDTYEGVVGSLIVGHDGLVMASTLKEGWDKDILGALSTALLSTSNLTTKKLEIGKLRQMVMLTKIGAQEKTTVLTDVDVGILAVFVEETDVARIDGMLDLIHKTIHG